MNQPVPPTPNPALAGFSEQQLIDELGARANAGGEKTGALCMYFTMDDDGTHSIGAASMSPHFMKCAAINLVQKTPPGALRAFVDGFTMAMSAWERPMDRGEGDLARPSET